MGLGSKTTWMRSCWAASERGGTEKERGAWAGQGPKEQRTMPWGEQACPACQATSGPPSALSPPLTSPHLPDGAQRPVHEQQWSPGTGLVLGGHQHPTPASTLPSRSPLG